MIWQKEEKSYQPGRRRGAGVVSLERNGQLWQRFKSGMEIFQEEVEIEEVEKEEEVEED